MLERAVREMKGEAGVEVTEIQLNLGLNIRIPSDYIKEENQRLRMYKRVAGVETESQLHDVRAELIDRYGETPRAVRNLLEYAALKLQAMRVGANAIERKREFVSIKFSPNALDRSGKAGALCGVAARHAVHSGWHAEVLDQDRQRRGNLADAARFAGRAGSAGRSSGPNLKSCSYNCSAMKPTPERRTNSDRRKNRVVRKAVFPAAGLGTRFLPATKAQPKEMLPLVDKPIIQYGVEEALAAGCDQIIMITGRGKSAIEDHFDVSYELERMLEEKGKLDLLKIVRQISDMIHVAYVRQKEALGLGHAVLTARELVGDEPFATLLADDVIDAKVPVLKQLMNVFEEKQCSVIATQVVDGPAISSYGVMKAKQVAGSGGRLYEVLDLVEKPKLADAPSNSGGDRALYSDAGVFETLSDIKPGAGGELQLTDGLRGLLQREKMYAYVYEGHRFDTGDKLGFLKATVEFALKREDLGGEFREYLKNLKL